jgi:hypothetical protein
MMHSIPDSGRSQFSIDTFYCVELQLANFQNPLPNSSIAPPSCLFLGVVSQKAFFGSEAIIRIVIKCVNIFNPVNFNKITKKALPQSPSFQLR